MAAPTAAGPAAPAFWPRASELLFTRCFLVSPRRRSTTRRSSSSRGSGGPYLVSLVLIAVNLRRRRVLRCSPHPQRTAPPASIAASALRGGVAALGSPLYGAIRIHCGR
jgi:hypothetical protein